MQEPVIPARFFPASEGNPALICTERAFLACQCTVAIGRRTDTGEASIGVMACSDPLHEKMMDEVHKELLASTDSPTDKYIVDVADEIMTRIARKYR